MVNGQEPEGRRPYQKPVAEELGTLVALTQGISLTGTSDDLLISLIP